MAQPELCFIAFPIVPLTKSSNNDQKLLGETYCFSKSALSALERRKVKYPVDPLNFLESDLFDCFIITNITIAINISILSHVQWQILVLSGCRAHSASNLSILSHVPDTDEFSADLVVVVLRIKNGSPTNLLKA